MKRLYASAAWLIAAVIVLSTLLPISYRPHLPLVAPDIERFCAYFALTAALMLAYPRKRAVIAWAMAAFVITLELAQLVAPGRHGMTHDAVVKLLGVGLAMALSFVASWRHRTEPGH